VAGWFYPRDAHELTHTVDHLLGAARAAPRAHVRGIIAPHAGYRYSGPIAAEAFAALRGNRFRRAIVIGPSHYLRFEGLAAPSCAAFATPAGEMPLDTGVVAELAAEKLVVIDDAPHAPDHAIEVELPFLLATLGAVPIVPLLFGETTAERVAATIARLWTAETLLVVSSDLSHFEPDESARRHDARTAAAIETFDEASIGGLDACGHMAIRGALIEAERRGDGIERLDLRTSGDAAGDRASVVGYGAWVIAD
jgi:AmmeMemoRadiSam system protein B